MAVRRKSGLSSRGAGDRVLEGRHVIGLFLLILMFSALFFALGFKMGQSQTDVIAGIKLPRIGVSDPLVTPRPLPGKHTNGVAPQETPQVSERPVETPENPAWKIHEPENTAVRPDHVDASPNPTVAQRGAPAVKTTAAPVPASSRNKTSSAPFVPTGSYTLQVAALRSRDDALDLSRNLQKRKFPSFVAPPQGDKFYRVQVGPYPDQKSAEAARKGLDAAGFKAIVKH
ncbi:MAG TPA: SPOR domain-containing protein [Candidatus Dormibacteraeota bacterium]|nr:SPOR domain-containing protein [Candidatus Dormibacteraeota bacterium]